jgi:hypothetical protein
MDGGTVGQNDLIDVYEDEVTEKIINRVQDFEVTRYTHKETEIFEELKTNINYKFHFFDRTEPVINTDVNDESKWLCDYSYTNDENFADISFTEKELYYYANSFKNSFFKLDFYDSKDIEDNKHYFTIILPTQQGVTRTADIGTPLLPKVVDIKTPDFNLDFIGDKEGYFIYWLKNPQNLNISDFYMSAKFFNAKNGQFTRFLNSPQSSIPKKHNFNKSKYYFYRVNIDYENYEYSVYDINTGNRRGNITPIKWYEYINP